MAPVVKRGRGRPKGSKNTAKGANRKYVSGGNRRSMRDLQAKCKDPSMLLFDLEGE